MNKFARDATPQPIKTSAVNLIQIDIEINGREHRLTIDTRSTLLDLLREELHLTGTKKGCDHGLCGACTVSVDGERVVSCLTLAASVGNAKILTVEGLSEGNQLTELQQAFLDHDAFQCGYCTPGQLSSAHAMLLEHVRGDLSMVSFQGTRNEVVNGEMALSENEIRERMAGNICRCGAYANIVAAVRAVSQRGQL